MAAPPISVIEAAILAACKSPCQKSKRGAVVFHPFGGYVGIPAFNSRPDMKCDPVCQPTKSDLIIERATRQGSPTACARMCLHAEQRAIRFALVASHRSQFIADGDFSFPLEDCELVHVKVVDGNLVPSGGPSCILCAKEIADVPLHGVWLYESMEPVEGFASAPSFVPAKGGVWNFYPTKQFWERTLKECGLT